MSEQNKALLHRAIEAHNRHDMEALMAFATPDFVDHTRQGDVDLQTWVKNTRAFFAAFPDAHVTTEDMVVERDIVAARYTARGTHKGEFQGIAPTGKQVTWRTIAFYRLAGNKVAERWTVADDVTQQLR